MWEPQDDTKQLVLDLLRQNPRHGYAADTVFYKLILDGNRREMPDVRWAIQELHEEGKIISGSQGQYHYGGGDNAEDSSNEHM